MEPSEIYSFLRLHVTEECSTQPVLLSFFIFRRKWFVVCLAFAKNLYTWIGVTSNLIFTTCPNELCDVLWCQNRVLSDSNLRHSFQLFLVCIIRDFSLSQHNTLLAWDNFSVSLIFPFCNEMQRSSIHVVLCKQQCSSTLRESVELIEAFVEFVNEFVILTVVWVVLAGNARHIKLVQHILNKFYGVIGLFVIALSLFFLDYLLFFLLFLFSFFGCWGSLDRDRLLYWFLQVRQLFYSKSLSNYVEILAIT